MKTNSGFTLVELMVTVMVAAILISIGTPAFKRFIQNGRVTQVTNELISAIHVARSEAVRRNSTACVCSSDTAGAPVPACSGGGQWESGWVAFLDTNGNCIIDGAQDTLVKAWDGADLASQITVRLDAGNASIGPANSIQFNTRGEPRQNNISQQGTYSICDDRGLEVDGNNRSISATAVIFSPSGHARSTRDAQFIACP